MINIKSQNKGLNLQTDTDSLDRAYFSPLELLYISHYLLSSRPCQIKTVMYTSHSAFDFLVTPMCSRVAQKHWSYWVYVDYPIVLYRPDVLKYQWTDIGDVMLVYRWPMVDKMLNFTFSQHYTNN